MCAAACALMSAQAVAAPHPAGAWNLQASLVTCWPGPEIYELEGHEALRIKGIGPEGEPIDSVWNYGVFDFNAPNFVYRFVKGETDYMVWGYPFSWFMPQYMERGSRVVEQVLRLTPEETLRLLRMLRTNALESNRTYRYNYVRDNCSTRVAVMLDSAVAPRRIIYPSETQFTTFREAMRYYHRNYPWYQFGIDLALGSGIDREITSRREIFAPMRFMDLASGASFAGSGTPLVEHTRVLYNGMSDATLPPTPWYLTPMAVSVLLLLISAGVALYEWRRRRIVKWWMTLFFTLLGLMGCVVWFLVFCSSHDSTSPNILFLWLTPLQFVPATMIWWRRTRPVAVAMAVVDILVIVVMVSVWPLQVQSTNPAVFPLWAATLILSAAYAMLYPRIYMSDGSLAEAPGFIGAEQTLKRGISPRTGGKKRSTKKNK